MILLNATSVFSQDPPKRGMDMSGWYLSPGIAGGISGSHLYYGGEVSAFYMPKSTGILYLGIFADADKFDKGSRIIAGPEVGILFLGCDTGYLSQWEGKSRKQGFTIRPYLGIPLFFITERVHIPAIPVLDIFYRRTFVKNDDANEFGFQFKFLIGLSR